MFGSSTRIARGTGLRFRIISGLKKPVGASSESDAKYKRHCKTVQPFIKRSGWVVGSAEHHAWWNEQERDRHKEEKESDD